MPRKTAQELRAQADALEERAALLRDPELKKLAAVVKAFRAWLSKRRFDELDGTATVDQGLTALYASELRAAKEGSRGNQ